MDTYSLTHVPDGALIRNLTTLVHQERKNTALVLAHLAEVGARKLFVPAGYSSMFDYCVRVLGFSEDMTWKRTQVAKAGRQHPALFEAIEDGRLHLSGACLLAPRLTAENVGELLAASAHKTRAEIEKLLADRFPQSDVRSSVRALPAKQAVLAAASKPDLPGSPAPGQVQQPSPVSRPSRVAPIAPKRYALQTTLGEAAHGKLRYIQRLLSHRTASGDLPDVLEKAFDALIEKLEKERFGDSPRSPKRPSKDPRYVPKSVRRAVWQRDKDRCTFVSDTGVRCSADRGLELDHVLEVARGETSTVDNLRLRCRAHNQYAAEVTFGAAFMAAKRRRGGGEDLVRERPASPYAIPWVKREGRVPVVAAPGRSRPRCESRVSGVAAPKRSRPRGETRVPGVAAPGRSRRLHETPHAARRSGSSSCFARAGSYTSRYAA